MEFKLAKWNLLILLLIGLLAFNSCKDANSGNSDNSIIKKVPVKVPRFNKDTAYSFIEKQLEFGYRIPGSEASINTKNWLVKKLRSYGGEVVEQTFKASFLGKKNVDATNIIASFNPDIKQRVLLCAHWDSRMIAEKDSDPEKRDKPIYGADDGASGTAALIEIARTISLNPIDLGIDIILFDAEDQGVNGGAQSSWCLGSQYWSKNPHKRNYRAKYGILLDMIAAKGAVFKREGWSERYAPDLLDKVWRLAQGMGYGDLFQNLKSGAITDDHYYINTNIGIPTIDIINTVGTGADAFGPYHHRHTDNIEIIDIRNLRAVGQVVTAVIYKTSDNTLL